MFISLFRPSGLFRVRFNNLEHGSYRELIVLLGQVISPVARPLPTQDNKNTESQKDNNASSWIRIHDLSVSADEDISSLRLRGHFDRHIVI
jgi:hypothetical protein